ncbi:MAG TPA: hypothetical protein VG099_32300 [Gemmataceae bacterium]|nr:hypothetical protein [Gemmataceae bacterium]
MPALTHREDGGGRGIQFRELSLPDDQNFGTGSYRVQLRRFALRKDRGADAAIVLSDKIGIALRIYPGRLVAVELGKAEEYTPTLPWGFSFPHDLDYSVPHDAVVSFHNWQVSSVSIDGKPLVEHKSPSDPYVRERTLVWPLVGRSIKAMNAGFLME